MISAIKGQIFGLKMDQLFGVFSLLCVRTEGWRSEDSSPIDNCFACITGIWRGGKELHLVSSYFN